MSVQRDLAESDGDIVRVMERKGKKQTSNYHIITLHGNVGYVTAL